MATVADLKSLNEKLRDFPYVSGYTPTQADVAALQAIGPLVHLTRWLKHITSFSDLEMKQFPKAPAVSAGGDAKKSAPAAAKPADDDDNEVDLFGSDDDDEAEQARLERAKAYQEKKAAKPAVIAKSSILLDVKPWDDETNVDDIEKLVRGIQSDGLMWGASKKVPLAYGIHKLSIICVVEDAKVSVDWLTEQIENFDLVQSTDIAAFQKI